MKSSVAPGVPMIRAMLLVAVDPEVDPEVGYIYALVEARPGKSGVRYVGKSINPLARFRQHIWEARRRHRQGRATHKDRWILSHLEAGVEPQIVVLERVQRDDEDDAERTWIEDLRGDGHDLLNTTDGGSGIRGYRHSEETRARMSATRKERGIRPPVNRGHSEETRAKIGAKAKGRAIHRKTIEALQARKGQPLHSEEHKRDISRRYSGAGGPNVKLTEEQAQSVVDRLPLEPKEIAAEFGVDRGTISCIARGKTWKNLRRGDQPMNMKDPEED